MNQTRGVVVAGNWKMNQNVAESKAFFDSIGSQIGSAKEAFESRFLESVVFPPSLSVHACLGSSSSLPVHVGVQNAHWEESGAYTGEISGPMLKELGIQWVLVGHSERRQFFGETNSTAGQRTASLLKQGFRVMLCVGETKNEREVGQTNAVLDAQLREGIPKDIGEFLDGRLVIAYEPVWAIGTGLTATPGQAEASHQFIREWILNHVNADAAGKTSILYGGSVKPDNFAELLAQPNIDGGLVGGASLKPDSFAKLIQIGAESFEK